MYCLLLTWLGRSGSFWNAQEKQNKTEQKKKKKKLWKKEMRQFRISQIANQSQTCPSIGCHCQNKTQTKQEGPISPFLLGTRHVMFWRLSNFDGSYLLSMIQYWSTDRLFLCNLPTGKYEDREIKSKKKMQKEKEEEERKKNGGGIVLDILELLALRDGKCWGFGKNETEGGKTVDWTGPARYREQESERGERERRNIFCSADEDPKLSDVECTAGGRN